MCDAQFDTTRYTRQIQEDTEALIQCLIRTWIHHRYELGPFLPRSLRILQSDTELKGVLILYPHVSALYLRVSDFPTCISFARDTL